MSESPLYSLVAGEGDGFMLGLAAGDTAGGAWDLGYSYITEQATVISYQLIEERALDRTGLVRSLRELDGGEDGEQVYRAESPHFRTWLDRAAAGSIVPEQEPSADAFARAAPVGVAFRRDPDQLLDQAISLGTMFHEDAATVYSGIVAAAAVAASCFAQSGVDLIRAVEEAVAPAPDRLGGLGGANRLTQSDAMFGRLADAVGVVEGSEALEVVGGDAGYPLQLALAGLLLAAPVMEIYHTPVEQAARVGGSQLGAFVGAMIGSRIGIRAWPWAFANDTWFAEIGRRLVRGPDETGDLPIPYAVEQHLMSGSAQGFH
ncbi:MAG: ADP-ribosylglycohydrolase family protein [Acidimicrobiia bacterium]|nr:ADP-ribosylglycohydrolase family protein [Acidimicrobiia bacterium]